MMKGGHGPTNSCKALLGVHEIKVLQLIIILY